MVAVAAERSAAATAGRAAVGPAEGEEEEARSEPTLIIMVLGILGVTVQGVGERNKNGNYRAIEGLVVKDERQGSHVRITK